MDRRILSNLIESFFVGILKKKDQPRGTKEETKEVDNTVNLDRIFEQAISLRTCKVCKKRCAESKDLKELDKNNVCFTCNERRSSMTRRDLDHIFDETLKDCTCFMCKKYYLSWGNVDKKRVCNPCNWKIDWKKTDSGNADNRSTCYGTRVNFCSNYRCKKCYEKSFISSDKAKYWNYALNGKRPRDVPLNSKALFYFVGPI